MKRRCFGDEVGKEFYADYHDNEWGVPVHDDRLLFEMLVLEGAQAGLNWETILKRRQEYHKAFYNFDVHKVAEMSDKQLNALYNNSGIIKNKLKIYSARRNAQAFIQIQKEFGSFDHYVWRFVDNEPVVNAWKVLADVPVFTAQSKTLSKDLKKRGMKFVGPIIMYAYMQAIGMINDHIAECWRYGQ